MGDRFRYALDPACWVGALCYGANSVFLHVRPSEGFFASYWNDLWMVPCALPLILWVHRCLGWRDSGAYPTVGEIVGHWLLWSLLAEGLGPRWMAHAVADPWDVVAYGMGALLAGVWWRWPRVGSEDGVRAAWLRWPNKNVRSI